MLKYNPEFTKIEVEKTSSLWGKILFAASICNRLGVVFEAYEVIAQHGYLKTIEKIKNEIWRSITCKSYQKNEMKEYVDWVDSIIPDDDDDEIWTVHSSLFHCATLSLAIAIDIFVDTYQVGELQNAVYVADHSYECVYEYVSRREKAKDYSVDFTPDPLVQQELLRQQRDLQELAAFDYENCSEETWRQFVEKFRMRSENEPALPDLSDFAE